ncbi:MAG: hypothetical protein WCS65_09515 [Verrucomicrobiae bacterium]
MKKLQVLTPSAAPGGSTKSEQPTSAMTVVATGPISDTEIGAQLTAQYQRAVSGMREVLIFGAMLKQVEARIAPGVRVRTPGGTFAGEKKEGGGLKGWLETHAPEISRSTAYRFLGITEAVMEEYAGIVGERIAEKYDMATLVTAAPESLPERARQKQGELFDYVSGTSQRSWLDQFKRDGRDDNGGPRKRLNGTKRRTVDEKEYDDKTKKAMSWYEFGIINLRECVQHPAENWLNLPDVELANVADLVKLWAKGIDEVCRNRRVVPCKLRNWEAGR